MAEAHARFKQYEYRANSSLVLTTDSRPRDTHESTGEPESLWGKIDPKSFGDRVHKGKPPELEEKKKNQANKKKLESVVTNRDWLPEGGVLTSTDEAFYQPKTKETRAAYEAMLSVIQQQLGGQPLNIVSGAADEVLAILKHEVGNNHYKKKEIEKLLNPISDHMFDQLVSIGKLITDYQDAPGSDTANADEVLDDVGVAVEFEENEEEEEEGDLDVVLEEEEDVMDATDSGGMQMCGGIEDVEMHEADEAMTSLNVQDIDAYWLQRKISQAYDQKIDPQQSQKLAEDILKIFAEGDDDREVERKLVLHLQFEKFSLIKHLLQNCVKIVWCTRLARAEDQEKRRKIEEEMMQLGPDHTATLSSCMPPGPVQKRGRRTWRETSGKRLAGY